MNALTETAALLSADAGGGVQALLQQLLPREVRPFTLAVEAWPVADAQRWRVLLARDAVGGIWALVDTALPSMLLERLESTCAAPVRSRSCSGATLDALLRHAEQAFRALDTIGAQAQGAAARGASEELSARRLAEQASPVVRLIDATLHDALQDGASDLHFECTAEGLNIRCRLDGVMQDLRTVDGATLSEQVVSRLKVMAALDIGERRLPQDGRFQLRMAGREIDFRLSVMPTVFGEDAVVRLLDRAQVERAQGQLSLAALGFEAAMIGSLRRLASAPHGMLLVTGPTGSGKTTTLYAAIAEVNTGREKIITIEDPVEYQLPRVVQIPVNDKKGLTFARGLRSVLRHDPDRVMVGEIRDAETAQIAVQAALTGHLVFSTVHANSALDVLGRFLHMGLDAYNLVSALNAVLAQRLMRVNCAVCSEPVSLRPEQLAARGLPAHSTLRRGTGCAACRQTGYKGRRAVAELMILDDALRDLIVQRAPLGQVRQAAVDAGMLPLRAAALALVARGLSTPEELDRVTVA